MKLYINKKENTIADGTTLKDIIELNDDCSKGFFNVVVNNKLIPKYEYSNYILKPNDEILIFPLIAEG